jgi:threonine aldolase
VDLGRVQTNIVYVQPTRLDAAEFLAGCRSRGVLGGGGGDGRVRFVTHFGIEPADVQRTLAVCAEVLAG